MSTRLDLGIGPEQLDGLPGNFPLFCREVIADEFIQDVAFNFVLGPPRSRRDRFATVWAELVVRGEKFTTVATRLSLWIRLGFRLLDDAGPLPDGLVVLLAGDVLVHHPHVRVDLPVDAVLDLRAGVALATHTSDGRVAEVVRVDGLLYVSGIGRGLQTMTESVWSQRPVTFEIVAVTGQVMEEGHVVLVRSWVGLVEVGPQRRSRVDNGIVHYTRTLQPARVRVRSVRRLFAIERDVTDTERTDERESGPGIREELDEGDIAKIWRRIDEGADVLAVEHIVRGDGTDLRGDQVVVISPGGSVDIDRREELPDDELVVANGSVGHTTTADAVVIVVSKVIDVFVECQFVEFDERAIELSRSTPEVLEILRQRGRFHTSVPFADETLDIRSIILMKMIETRQLVIELTTEALEVLEIAHAVGHHFEDCKAYLRKNRLFGLDSLAKSPPSGVVDRESNTLVFQTRTRESSVESDVAIRNHGGGSA